MHLWVKKHKRWRTCQWQELYGSPNYLLLFIQSHPGYELNPLELIVLKLATELVPRILEQELFNHYSKGQFFYWNKQKRVRYYFTSQTLLKNTLWSALLTSLRRRVRTVPRYCLMDAKTGMPIRNFYCLGEARATLGIINQFDLGIKVTQNTPIKTDCYPDPFGLCSRGRKDVG